jgi:hypothetical protein
MPRYPSHKHCDAAPCKRHHACGAPPASITLPTMPRSAAAAHRRPSPKASRTGSQTGLQTASGRRPVWFDEGQCLTALMSESELGPSALGRVCGVPYHTIYRWCRGHELTPPNQARACAALGLDPDALQCTPAAQDRARAWLWARGSVPPARAPIPRVSPRQRALEQRAVLDAFRARPIAAALTAEDWHVIESIRWFDARLRPSAAFYEAVAFALKGAIRVDEMREVARANAELDRTIAHKRARQTR